MKHTIRAPCAGTAQAFHYQSSDLVDSGTMLLDFAASGIFATPGKINAPAAARTRLASG